MAVSANPLHGKSLRNTPASALTAGLKRARSRFPGFASHGDESWGAQQISTKDPGQSADCRPEKGSVEISGLLGLQDIVMNL